MIFLDFYSIRNKIPYLIIRHFLTDTPTTF